MSTSPDAPPPRKPGPSILVSVLVMLAGAAIAITGLAVGVSSAIHRVTHVADGPRGELPSRFDATLTAATWQVYVADSSSAPGPVALTPADVTVTDAAGTPIPARDLPGGLTEEIDAGGRAYVAAVRFDVPRMGAYRVIVRAERRGAGTPVIIARSLGSDLSGLGKWFAMTGAGFLLGCIGFTMLIAGIVRRRSARAALARLGGYGAVDYPGRYVPAPTGPPSAPPDGWYDDPHLPGMQRFWDGSRWTDQTRNTS